MPIPTENHIMNAVHDAIAASNFAFEVNGVSFHSVHVNMTLYASVAVDLKRNGACVKTVHGDANYIPEIFENRLRWQVETEMEVLRVDEANLCLKLFVNRDDEEPALIVPPSRWLGLPVDIEHELDRVPVRDIAQALTSQIQTKLHEVLDLGLPEEPDPYVVYGVLDDSILEGIRIGKLNQRVPVIGIRNDAFSPPEILAVTNARATARYIGEQFADMLEIDLNALFW